MTLIHCEIHPDPAVNRELRRRCLQRVGVAFARFQWDAEMGAICLYTMDKNTRKWDVLYDITREDGNTPRQVATSDVDDVMWNQYGNDLIDGWYGRMKARRKEEEAKDRERLDADENAVRKASRTYETSKSYSGAMKGNGQIGGKRDSGDTQFCEHGEELKVCRICAAPQALQFSMAAKSGSRTNGKFVVHDRRRLFDDDAESA